MWPFTLRRRPEPVVESVAVVVPMPPVRPSDYPQRLFDALYEVSGQCGNAPRVATGDPEKDAALIYAAGRKWVDAELGYDDQDDEDDEWDDDEDY